MKEDIIKIICGIAALLWLGGAICILVTAFTTMKAFVPILASCLVIAAGVPTIVRLIKEHFIKISTE